MQEHRSGKRLGLYCSTCFPQGVQLADELAGLGAGCVHKLFRFGGKPSVSGRVGPERGFQKPPCGLLCSSKDNSPLIQQFDVGLLQVRDNPLDNFSMLLLLGFPENDFFENAHRQQLPVDI
ncbi:hypothetical protein D3C75_969280 [compost metagenome]